MKPIICLLFCVISLLPKAQEMNTPHGKEFRIGSKYAMFPDSLRNISPRVYNGVTYNTKEHYSDSSAYIFVPDYFEPNKPYQFVFWFHGWGNNIDTGLAQFKVKEQFYAARLNAILVFPEGPKNAPDSYGGKFEKADTFNHFVKDVSDFLLSERLIQKNKEPEFIYAGHSGAYEVMSFLLLHSKYRCRGFILFDALYGQEEKFTMQLQQDSKTKCINIFTDEGGTYNNSKKLITDMKAWKWKFLEKEEDDCTLDDLKNNRIIFMHSKKKHGEVINNNNNLQHFLEAMK
jgi:predicted esterase